MYAVLCKRKRSFCKNFKFGLFILAFHYGSCFNASLSRYFLIPTSNENNFIYSSLKHQRGRQNSIFVVAGLRSILYSSKIFVYKLTGLLNKADYDWALWNIGVRLKLLAPINCQTTIVFRAIFSLHFHHLWACHTVHHIIQPHMSVCHTVRNVGLPHLGFLFPVGLPPSYRNLQGYLLLTFSSLVGPSHSEL